MFTVSRDTRTCSALSSEAFMNFFKALIPGTLLAWIGVLMIGHGGSHGGFLGISTFMVQGHTVH